MPPPSVIKPLAGPSLVEVLAAAQQLRAQRQQQQQNQWQFERAKAEDERHQDFNTLLAGQNPEEARLADPLQYDRWQREQAKAQLEARKNALEMRKTEYGIAKDQGELVDAEQKRNENAQRLVLAKLAQDPTRLGDAMALRDQLVKERGIQHFTLPGEGRTDTAPDGGWVQAAPTRQEVVGAQRAAGADPYAGLANDVKDYLQRYPNDSPDSPGFGTRVDAWDRQNRRSSATNVSTNVNANSGGQANSPLTTANTTEQQKNLISTRDVLHSLDEVRQMGDPAQFLTRGSKLGQFALSEIDKVAPGAIGPDGEKFIGDAVVFRSRIKQFFNNYRKMITGAGASSQELDMLEQSVLNDKLSPAQFKAMLDDTVNKAQRDEKIISNLLQRQVPLGADDFARAFDEARYRGESPAAAGAQADASQPQPTANTGKGKNQRTVAAPRMSVGDLKAEAERYVASDPRSAQLTPEQRSAAVLSYIKLHGTPPQ